MNRLLLLLLLTISIAAQADDCDHTSQIERMVDAATLNKLDVTAGAGRLKIMGYKGSSEIKIAATLCASSKKNLKRMDVVFDVAADTGSIKTDMPDNSGLFFSGSNSIDLALYVPESMLLNVKDSSGSADIENVAGLMMVDSSGSLSIKNVTGEVDVTDSSGSILIEQVVGSVKLSDSSGAIDVNNVGADVLVRVDSSGSISAQNVTGDFVVNVDSSGSISAANIGGHFWVRKDSSGGIHYRNIGGQVDIPKGK